MRDLEGPTSFRPFENTLYIYNHIYIPTYLQVNITGRNIVLTAAREAGLDTGFVAVDDFLVFAGEDKCATQPEAAR